ncbi:hypothetical protein [Gottfriedia acidiceleris]|uniref:hypothetical protein n=1 Tax=Gottfriedia acidiceleris TaxID=371036 RepID=UPI003D1FFD87
MLENRFEQKIILFKKIKGNLKRNTALLVCTSLVFLVVRLGIYLTNLRRQL